METGIPNIVPYRSFRCRDADIALAVGNDGQFVQFAAVAGHPEWATDPRFARNRDRVANRALIDGLMEETLICRTADEWIEALLAVGVPCGRINTVQQALAAPQTAATDMVIEMRTSDGRPVPLARHSDCIFGHAAGGAMSAADAGGIDRTSC